MTNAQSKFLLDEDVDEEPISMEEYLKKEASSILENFTVGYLSRIDNCKRKARVDNSSIHGRGLFANCDIKQGEIITYYPSHFVIIKPNGYNRINGEIERITINSSFNNGKAPTYDHTLVLDEYLSICGDSDLVDNADFLAHMSNDAMKCKSTNFNDKATQIYELLSKEKNNSVIEVSDSSCIYLRATRNIEVNEEITNGYGYQHWVTHNLRKHNELK